MKTLLTILSKLFSLKVEQLPALPKYYTQCSRCHSFNMEHSHWRRGWNNLCEQACGDTGRRCYDCGYIRWDRSSQEYQQTLPEWCTAYPD